MSISGVVPATAAVTVCLVGGETTDGNQEQEG
jgi:hypothetical protein